MTKILIYALIVLAILATIVGGVWAIYHKGYSAGEAAIRLEWEQANRAAEEEATKVRLAREAEGREASTALQQAEERARDHETRWKTARRAQSSVPLAVCPEPVPGPANLATATVAAPRPDSGPPQLRLTYGLLRDYDTAWTGQDGEPVFRDPPRPPEAALAAGSPVTLPDLLDAHAENARRCSENSRQLGKLVTLIRRLQGQ